tara:strand:+ start:2061 stop:2282 length:222 start_codon:yes stop_codon:yes gene_type:complete
MHIDIIKERLNNIEYRLEQIDKKLDALLKQDKQETYDRQNGLDRTAKVVYDNSNSKTNFKPHELLTKNPWNMP